MARAGVVSMDAARRAQRALRAVWLIVSARHEDALAEEVERMGQELARAIQARDLAACADSIDEARAWLSTSGGVVLARLQHVFEHPDS
jgi:hypothetical protein